MSEIQECIEENFGKIIELTRDLIADMPRTLGEQSFNPAQKILLDKAYDLGVNEGYARVFGRLADALSRPYTDLNTSRRQLPELFRMLIAGLSLCQLVVHNYSITSQNIPKLNEYNDILKREVIPRIETCIECVKLNEGGLWNKELDNLAGMLDGEYGGLLEEFVSKGSNYFVGDTKEVKAAVLCTTFGFWGNAATDDKTFFRLISVPEWARARDLYKKMLGGVEGISL